MSREAKEWLQKTIEGKRVTVVPHRIDQFGRVVATVFFRKWLLFRHNLSVEIVKQGYATIYTSGGAEYGGFLEELEKQEKIAKFEFFSNLLRKKKIGIWGLRNFKSPMEYKKELRK